MWEGSRSDLSFSWLGCTWVWLINEDTLGCSMDRDAGCFPRDSQTCPVTWKELVLLKDPEPFLRLQCQNTKNEWAASQHHESWGFLFRRSLIVGNAFGFCFFFALCFTFLWMAILNSMRRAANMLAAVYSLCIYLHFKIVLKRVQKAGYKLKSFFLFLPLSLLLALETVSFLLPVCLICNVGLWIYL